MRKLLLALVLSLPIIFAVTAAAQSPTVQLSPVRSDLKALPGQEVSATITLRNPTNKQIAVQIIPKDFEASDKLDGDPKILDQNNSPYGISNWLADANVDRRLNVPANQNVTYSAVFRVPASAVERTYYGIVTFRTDNGTDQPATSVGSLVFITVGNPKTALEATELSHGESDDAAKRYGVFTAVIKNGGEGLSRPEISLKITDETGAVTETLKPDEAGSILPVSSRRFSFTPTQELSGRKLTATLSASDDQGSTADKSIQLNLSGPETVAEAETLPINSAGKLPLIGLAALLALLAGVTALYLRKRRLSRRKHGIKGSKY